MHFGDEKVMPFRKTMHSGASFDAKDPSESSFSGVTSEDSNKLGFNVETHKSSSKISSLGFSMAN